jgi:hypothetical protein
MSSPTTTCSHCRAAVPAEARYCPECGSPLAEVRTFGTPPSVPPGIGRGLSKLRLRGRAFVETVSAQTAARREVAALRYELEELRAKRDRWLRDLGLAVYDGDDAGSERGKAAIRGLDQEILAKEEQMTQTALQAQAHVAQVQAESRPTVLLEPPQPAPVPEPYPPPDEGTPPTPAPVPEPYPPPDEGDPPQPG